MKGRVYAVRQAKKLLSQYRSAHGEDLEPGNFEIDVHAIAQHMGVNVVTHEFSENISGVFFRKDDNLHLGVNSQHHKHRQRFTIAHEIGHYLLHSNQMLHYDRPEVETMHFRADNISNLNEIEANHFAAELLMPEERVRELIDSDVTLIQELADRFNVSEDAMRYRLINLGYL
jgi:Zn-dependent peptidase ImmA (M78 family)